LSQPPNPFHLPPPNILAPPPMTHNPSRPTLPPFPGPPPLPPGTNGPRPPPWTVCLLIIYFENRKLIFL